MRKSLTILLIIMAGILAGCQTQTEELQSQLTGIEAQLDELSELQSEVEHLNHQLEAAAVREQVYQISMTNYSMEEAGFHAIDSSINTESVIEPEFLGTVNRIQVLLSSTNWPEALHPDLMTFQDTLTDFSDTLAAEDIDGAGPLAKLAHNQQHDFSHNINGWLTMQASGMEMEGMGSDDGHDHEHGERIPNEGGSAIRITSHSDGDMVNHGEDIVIEVEVENFTLGEEGSHWHVYVNGESFGMVVGGTLFQALTGLAPGDQEISVYLANGDHEEFIEGDTIHIMVHEMN